MTLKPLRAVLCACLLACFPGRAQEPAAQATAPSAAQPPAAPPPVAQPKPGASIPAPSEVPSNINTGREFSIQPIYWLSSLNTDLRPANEFGAQPRSGTLDFPASKPRAVGGMVTIPAGGANMVRLSYFEVRRQLGVVRAPTALSLFKSDASAGDDIVTSVQMSRLKVSFDYLTYFIKRGNSEFRVKTLWEIQRLGVTTDVTILAVQPDKTIIPADAGGEFNIIYPSVGIGLEHTMGRHFRWEAKASGMTLGRKKSTLGDADANAALRFGRIEFVAGARFLYFRSSLNAEHRGLGTMYGPYAGIRYYIRRTRPTAAAAPTSAGTTR